MNDGRRNNDGSGNWKEILLAGADIIQQFGNQSPDGVGGGYNERDWNDEVDEDRYRRETKILGMHPVTFGVVSLALVVVGGVVIYRVTKK